MTKANTYAQHHLSWVSFIALALTMSISSCGGCNGGGNGGRHSFPPGRPGDPAPETSTATSTQTETSGSTEKDQLEAEKAKDVGEEVPPVKPNEVSTIDTSAGGGLKHLIFESTDSMDLGRYLSEYLIVIRASEPSCVRLKFRPTGGVVNEASDEAVAGGIEGTGGCESTKSAGETKSAPVATATSTGTSTGTGTKALKFSGLREDRDDQDLNLAGRSAAICSSRLFRMENKFSGDKGLQKINTKTGRLAIVQGPIRIWIDEEFTNFCTGGISLDNRNPIPWGPLIQQGSVTSTWVDKLWTAHLQNLAQDMEKIYNNMTATYGPISDIDQNGVVEIFMSPDVNRNSFILYDTTQIDNFRAKPILKLEDLAFYNSESNPTSNEGEILYLWTPDPGGLYNQKQFPSGNSIASNYAKGHLSFQLFNLIYANERLFNQKRKKIDDPWIMQSLALLASAYYAGNDYTVLNLSQYLTSRPQYISLSVDLDPKLFSSLYLPMAYDEQIGMRTMFGWFLHTRLCGTSVSPCVRLKEIITSDKTGYEVLEKVLNDNFDKIANHFATTVALGLVDKPSDTVSLWDKTPNLKEPKPLLMADLQEIFAGSPPSTAEGDIISPAAILTADATDRTVAGPYPSRQMMFIQPISPEGGLEFKMAKDSIVAIQPTGFLDKQTDITAFFGKGLKIVFVPIGERDTNLRRIHFEKVSESAHGDLRPDNLTSLNDQNRTYMYEKTYESANFAVNPQKSLWVVGSIDNYDVNINGSSTEVQDSDSFNIEFRPCANAADKAACEASGLTYDAIVQVIPKDFEKEVAPMLLATTTDRTVFRGHSVLGRMTDLIKSWQDDPGTTSYQCVGSKFNRGPTITFSAGNPGVLTTQSPHGFATNNKVLISSLAGRSPSGIALYRTYDAVVINQNSLSLTYGGVNVPIGTIPTDTYYLHNASSSSCANGGVPGALVYSHEATKLNSQAYAHTYDNFLMMGPLGYPFNSFRTTYVDDAPCNGPYCYKSGESARQHYNFALAKDLKANTFRYYGANFNVKLPSDHSPLTSEEVNTLVMLKKEMDSSSCVAPRTDQAFLEECQKVAELTVAQCSNFCAKDNNHGPMDLAIRNYMTAKFKSLICYQSTGCDEMAVLLGTGYPPDPTNFPTRHSSQWVNGLMYTEYKSDLSAAGTRTSYYKPNEPFFGADLYCTGEPGTATTQLKECRITSVGTPTATDIREQFNAPANRIKFDCSSLIPTSEFDLCIDSISSYREFNPDKAYAFSFLGQSLPSDRVRKRRGLIYTRAGELVGKPERLQHVIFQIPATGGVANIIVGGRSKSQGKYMLRARLVDFDL